jgi:PAS domain S-box-containing protein
MDHGGGHIEELRTNARLLSLIYDHASDPVYLVRVEPDGRYRFVSANEAFLRATGHQAGEVVGALMERVLPNDDVRRQVERAIDEREPIVYEESAGERFAEITLIPIFEGEGPVTHILADVKDISARRKLEIQREQLLANTVFLSDATRLLASLDIEQALGDVARLAVPYLGDGCAIDFFGNGGPRRVVAIARDPRNPMFVDVHPTVLGGNALTYQVGSTACLGVPLVIKGVLAGAITMRAEARRQYTSIDLRLAEELGRRAAMAIDNARLYRQAQAALKARDDFLTIAAHEIRGPITSIHLAVQGLLQAKVPSAASGRALELIEREDRRLSRFVDELLDLGELRAGHLRFQLEPVNLADVLQDAVKQLTVEVVASGSPVSVKTPPDIVGDWDRFRLTQVVTNLLSNAIKFGLGKPIEIDVSTTDDRVRVTVRDQGVGIEPTAQERIFNPFERNVSTRHYGGLGIGLHIVKTVVEAMGGRVSVDSAPGVGATFVVELPRHIGEGDAHPDH